MSGKYIVSFKKGTPQQVIDTSAKDVLAKGGKITHRYDGTVLLGYAASIPDNALETLTVHEHVKSVESDGIVTAFAKEKGIK